MSRSVFLILTVLFCVIVLVRANPDWAPADELDPFVGQWLDYNLNVYTFVWDQNGQSLNLSINNTGTPVSCYWIPPNTEVYPNIVDQTLCQLSSYSPRLGESPTLDQCDRLLWWYQIFSANILSYVNNDPSNGFTLVPDDIVRDEITSVHVRVRSFFRGVFKYWSKRW
jgi:hypothetical protein